MSGKSVRRHHFVGGSDARIVISDDKGPSSANLIVHLGLSAF